MKLRLRSMFFHLTNTVFLPYPSVPVDLHLPFTLTLLTLNPNAILILICILICICILIFTLKLNPHSLDPLLTASHQLLIPNFPLPHDLPTLPVAPLSFSVVPQKLLFDRSIVVRRCHSVPIRLFPSISPSKILLAVNPCQQFHHNFCLLQSFMVPMKLRKNHTDVEPCGCNDYGVIDSC